MNKQFVALIILVLGVAGAAFATEEYTRSVAAPSSDTEILRGPNVSDPSVVIGASHVVFVGKVIRTIGNDNYPSSNVSSTQFDVRVVYNIKGNVQGTVTLAQIRGVEPLAQVGSTYIFAARYNSDSGWYTFGIAESYQLISQDASLADHDLQALAEKDSTVLAMQQAYPHEQFPYTDIKYHTTYNSYVSRHYDAQGNLIDDTVVLHNQYQLAHPSAVPSVSPADNVSSVPAAQAPTPVNAPTDTTSPAVSTPATDSVSPTPAPTVIAPTDTPTPAPTDTSVPTASPGNSSVNL